MLLFLVFVLPCGGGTGQLEDRIAESWKFYSFAVPGARSSPLNGMFLAKKSEGIQAESDSAYGPKRPQKIVETYRSGATS